jgi:hypothetical protein
MNLLQQVKQKLNDKPVDKSAGRIKEVHALSKLPDHEKVKVLDYLSAVKDLHKDHEQ